MMIAAAQIESTLQAYSTTPNTGLADKITVYIDLLLEVESEDFANYNHRSYGDR